MPQPDTSTIESTVPQDSDADFPSLSEAVVTIGVVVLLVARMLRPTEGPESGEGLWLVQGCLVLGAIWAWSWRSDARTVRFDWSTLAMGLLVGGHVVSALMVLAGGGDKRAALNMLWEWIGLGVLFLLIRSTLARQGNRGRLLLSMVAIAAAISGLGIWQHYVWYPQNVAKYGPILDELDRLESAAPTGSAVEKSIRIRRIHELQNHLAEEGIPFAQPERGLWDKRLRASTEPFGFFALANTLAGLLVGWLIVSVAMLFVPLRKGSWVARCGTGIAVGTIAYCLVLTKSRSAWLAGLLALVLWCVFRSGAAKVLKRHPMIWLGGAALVVGLFFVADLDYAVLSEAPKSLAYRMHYWHGTWDVIRDNPVFGAGPGNFRQHYLEYKPVWSSEEINDPHNVLLDVWVNGGIVALLGLVGLMATAIGGTVNGPQQSEPREPIAPRRPEFRGPSGWLHPVWFGSGLGFAVVAAESFLIRPGDNETLGILAMTFAGWLVLASMMTRGTFRMPLSHRTLVLALVALFVHLLAAGGIGMPAISQTLILLVALCLASRYAGDEPPIQRPPGRARERGRGRGRGRLTSLVATATFAALFLVCLGSATIPVAKRQMAMAAGDFAYIKERSFDRANESYQQAAEADPLSSDPWRRMAEVDFALWQADALEGAPLFERSVNALQEAVRRDPDGPFDKRRIGQMYLAKFGQSENPQHARDAAEYLAAAVARYPSHAMLRSEYALSLWSAGQRQDAGREAQRALSIHGINVEEGHVDRFLSAEILDRLSLIVDENRKARADPPIEDAD